MPAKKSIKGKQVENSMPLNTPMSGVFDAPWNGGPAAASTGIELFTNNSYQLMSLQRIMLSYAYVLHGPLRTLVDQPVYDAFRGGVKVCSDEVDPDELEDFHREFRKMKCNKAIINAMRWDRLFGGAGLIINTNQDYKTSFNVNSVHEGSKLSFIAADRWELVYRDPSDYAKGFDYYGKPLHPTRVAKIVGEEPPSIVKQRLQGWGMSVIECVIRELSSYFKHHNVIFELLDEAKVDVWKIKGFNSQVLANMAQGKTAKRIQIAQNMKNFLNAITLDAEDDYEKKEMTFTGLAAILEQIQIGIAAACRMPMAKLFGLSAKGFASGEDDIENYNAIVENERERAEDVLDLIVPIIAQKVWGMVPDDLYYEWKPLRVLSAEQEENVKDAKFQRHSTLYSQGIYDPQEYCEALKQDELLTIDTKVAKGADPEPPMTEFAAPEEEVGAGGSAKKPSGGKTPKKAKE